MSIEENKKSNSATSVILNVLIVLLTVIGTVLIMTIHPRMGTLQTNGLENFKYYTVLSNVLCGLAALIYLIFTYLKKDTSTLIPLKLGAVCSTTITFCVVAFFFGPLYGWIQFYYYANLVFHLLEPVLAIAEFLYTSRKYIPFRYTVYSAVPTLIYGLGYGLNIMINGMGGPWPDSNDFYGFLHWGWNIGTLILLSTTFIAFLIACIFRKLCNSRAGKV